MLKKIFCSDSILLLETKGKYGGKNNEEKSTFKPSINIIRKLNNDIM